MDGKVFPGVSCADDKMQSDGPKPHPDDQHYDAKSGAPWIPIIRPKDRSGCCCRMKNMNLV